MASGRSRSPKHRSRSGERHSKRDRDHRDRRSDGRHDSRSSERRVDSRGVGGTPRRRASRERDREGGGAGRRESGRERRDKHQHKSRNHDTSHRQVSDRGEVGTRSRGDDQAASDTRNRADVKDDSKVVRTKSSKKKAKTTSKLGAPALSFADDIDETDTGPRVSLGELTLKRFKEAPPAEPNQLDGTEVFSTALLSVLGARGGGGGILAMEAAPGRAQTSMATLRIGTAQTRGQRPYMEDRHTVVTSFLPDLALKDGLARSYFGLFDGHNGARAAEMAAYRLHTLLGADTLFKAASDNAADNAVVTSALTRAFLAMDREMLTKFEPEEAGDGCTALVLVRIGGAMYAAHAGDSRAVMCVGEEVRRITEDHKPNRPDEKSRVESVGGSLEFSGCWRVVSKSTRGSHKALAVSRSLGDREFKGAHPVVSATPEVGRIDLKPECKFVIMASDGLWDVLEDQEAVDIAKLAMAAWQVANGANASVPYSSAVTIQESIEKVAAEKLIKEALAKGSLDNITVVVVVLPWE